MYILRIITFFITIAFISVASCELPTPDDFIVKCNLKNKCSIATELKTMLDNADYDDRIFWLSNFNDKYGSPLIYAININNLPVAEIIIQSMIQQDIKYHEFSISNGKSLLVFATMAINYRLIDILLHYNHPINIGYGENKTSALHEAAKLGDISLCKRFINDKSSFLLHVEDYENIPLLIT